MAILNSTMPNGVLNQKATATNSMGRLKNLFKLEKRLKIYRDLRECFQVLTLSTDTVIELKVDVLCFRAWGPFYRGA